MKPDHSASFRATLAALAAVYIIWGSTYLGIRIGIETIPPFLMAGTRFLIPAAVLLVWAWRSGAKMPSRPNLQAALVVGLMMPAGGSGGVTWAEQRIPSGLAALIIGAVPLWIVLLNWIGFGGTRPNQRMTLGLVIGVTGLAILIGPSNITGGDHDVDPLAAVVTLGAALSWAIGSLFSRRAALPESWQMSIGLEMLTGGIILYLAGFASGETRDFALADVSQRSALAVLYLALLGSLVAYSAYVWLLRHTTPARAASYAYVNPVFAVIVGWALADEALSARMLLAAVIIVGSVALITSSRAQQSERVQAQPARVREQHAPSSAGK